MQTAARNAAEIVAPIEVVTADVAPAAEAVAGDVAEAAQAAVAAAVSAAADTAEVVTNHPKNGGRASRPSGVLKGRDKDIAAFILSSAHVGAGVSPAQPSKARPFSGRNQIDGPKGTGKQLLVNRNRQPGWPTLLHSEVGIATTEAAPSFSRSLRKGWGSQIYPAGAPASPPALCIPYLRVREKSPPLQKNARVRQPRSRGSRAPAGKGWANAPLKKL